ncbi:MAG: signal peptidase I [Bacilli bacterium]|nr:signal peptidase I [Bacilli bacterium]
MKVIKTIIEYLFIIILVIIIRTFIVTPIEVTGRSMETTLHNKDIMILNIIGYRLNGIERFDIVVIKEQDEYLIKRVIGLPGEIIEYKDNQLYINNKLNNDIIDYPTDDFTTTELTENGVIPNDKYFVLGDNRNNSADSRIIGLIDKNKIIGKTNLIIFPFKHFGVVK